MIILAEAGKDYRDRDLLDQVACLIEIFGVAGAAQIVGCLWVCHQMLTLYQP